MRVVMGIVHQDGKVLLRQRAGHVAFPKHWEFPGGKREMYDEGDFATVRRELREEMDILVASTVYAMECSFEPPVVKESCLLVYYHVHAFAGVPEAKEHDTAFEWVTLEDIAQRQCTPGVYKVLEHLKVRST